MQLAIELPDELGQKLLQHANVQQFVQEAICVMLLKEEQAQAQKERNRPLLELINSIEPVKTRYSSEEMVSLLRAGKEQLLIDAQTNHAP
jgi:hypothetical protein